MAVNNAVWVIEEIMQNPNLRVTIKLPDDANYPTIGKVPGTSRTQNNVIYGFLMDNLMFSTSASYGKIGPAIKEIAGGVVSGIAEWVSKKFPMASQGVDKVLSGLGKGIDLTKSLGGMGDTVIGSIKYWTGSTSTLPPIELLFVALRPTDRPIDSARALLSLNMPGVALGFDENNDEEIFFWAPNKYSPLNTIGDMAKSAWDKLFNNGNQDVFGYGSIPGTCTLEIGNWLKIPGLVPISAAFNVSPETTRTGTPLYVTGTVTFDTYRDLKASEFDRFFA